MNNDRHRCVSPVPRHPSSDSGLYGVTINVAVFLTPAYEATIVTLVFPETCAVCTVNVAELAPAGTVNCGGTAATSDLLLASVTTVPSDGARWVSVTVPCEAAPALTTNGFSVRDARATLGPVFIAYR